MNPPVRRLTRRLPLLFLATTALAWASGCSQQGASPPVGPSASAQAAANEAAAQKELKLYQQMLTGNSQSFALPVGEEIIQKYPDTAAATEVRKTLPKIKAVADAKAEHDRLANKWYYQTANVGGMQSTASIYSEPRSANSTRLVLRRHVKWGQSVYLIEPDGSKGFVCKDTCRIPMHFDGKDESWKAYRPPTGEPAMFIKDDKRFIATLEKAKLITMDVETRGHGKQTLKFEVGGYDPAKFLPLPKG